MSPIIYHIFLLSLLLYHPTNACVAYAVHNSTLIPYHMGLGIFIHPCAVLSTWAPRRNGAYDEFQFTTQQYYMPEYIPQLQAEYLYDARKEIDYVGTRKSFVLYAVHPGTMSLGLHRSIISNLTNHPLNNCFVILPRRPTTKVGKTGLHPDGLIATRATNVVKKQGILEVTFAMPPFQTVCPVDDGAPLICDFITVGLLRDSHCYTEIGDAIFHECAQCDNTYENAVLITKRYDSLIDNFADIHRMVKHMLGHSDHCSPFTIEEILTL